MQKLLLSFLILISQLAFAHQDAAVHLTRGWKIIAHFQSNDMMKDFKMLSELDVDIAGVDHKEKVIDILINDVNYEVLTSKGIDLVITEVKGVSTAPDREYHNPEEIEEFVHNVHATYPEITKLVSVGKSLEGRDIWALKISDNASEHEIDEPSLLFNSMHHAREIMTPEVSIDIIETLTEGYNSDNQITQWVNNNEIWVMPMFNVDGNNKMWNEDSWWRKNTRGGYGVDLNRNYPTGWNSCNGSSGRTSSQTYRGPNPASEPETQAMMKFIRDIRPVFDISYHSYSELVIYPFGCRDQRTPTEEVVEKIGKKVAKLLDYKPGTAWELLYNADGGDIDWMYEAFQVIPFVIELNHRRQGFHPDYSEWRDKTVERNRVGWQYLLDRVQESGVRGRLTLNGEGVSEYKLTVYKVVNNRTVKFQSYVGHLTGMYHLVLNPGLYELKFETEEGQEASVRTKVNSKLTTLNVELDV